jgi:hypothetical protein
MKCQAGIAIGLTGSGASQKLEHQPRETLEPDANRMFKPCLAGLRADWQSRQKSDSGWSAQSQIKITNK